MSTSALHFPVRIHTHLSASTLQLAIFNLLCTSVNCSSDPNNPQTFIALLAVLMAKNNYAEKLAKKITD